MVRKATIGERWLQVPKWQYEVSTFGHIRKRRSHKPINPWWDTDGYGTVLLKRGKLEKTFYLDSLICSTFTGRRLNDERPIHLDGLPWNNWPRNLQWGRYSDLGNGDNLVTNWTVWHRGKLASGPFNDHNVACAAAQEVGDVVVGRNSKRQIVAHEIMFSRNRDKSPRNPHDLAKQYQATAEVHANQFWSYLLSEAAAILKAMADENLNYINEWNTVWAADNTVEEPPQRVAIRQTRRRLPDAREQQHQVLNVDAVTLQFGRRRLPAV